MGRVRGLPRAFGIKNNKQKTYGYDDQTDENCRGDYCRRLVAHGLRVGRNLSDGLRRGTFQNPGARCGACRHFEVQDLRGGVGARTTATANWRTFSRPSTSTISTPTTTTTTSRSSSPTGSSRPMVRSRTTVRPTPTPARHRSTSRPSTLTTSRKSAKRRMHW